MELSTNILYLRKRRNSDEPRDVIECAQIARNAGFRYVDFSANFYLLEDGWEEETARLTNGFEKVGVVVDQTHAPSYCKKYDEETFGVLMRRALESTKMLGAENVVLHADRYPGIENGFDFEEGLKLVYDFYSPFVEYALSLGLNVAIENLCARRDGVRARFTEFVDEQIAIIDKFADPRVGACWDFGHGRVSHGLEDMDALKKIGKRLMCTHVHDNISFYRTDQHQNIFCGDVVWEDVVAYLQQINYTGKFTYEMVYGVVPDPFVQRYMDLYYEMGMYLLNRSRRTND